MNVIVRRARPVWWWLSLFLGLAGVLAVVWYTGAFDRQLSGAGLNKNPCVVTPYAGTLCGRDAEAWCAATEDESRMLAVGESRAPGCDDLNRP